MEEYIITIVIGVIFIIIGLMNFSGNIKTLHSYHRKRVRKEDEKPLGKIVGSGMIIIALSIIANGILGIICLNNPNEALQLIAQIIRYAGLGVGLILNIYGIIKYNKGLF